jgi:high frequency lysogenization protein
MAQTDNHNIRARTIALAGLFQAVQLVQQTGQGKFRNRDATHACIESIFSTDAVTVEAVYGELPLLRAGLELLDNQLGNLQVRRDLVLTGHVITILHLERKLSRNRTMLARLAEGIEQARKQAAYFEGHSPPVVAALAELYQQTISTLKPRIMVRGEPVILANPENQQMVRTLLLAGIRAAVLWRQCGGSRWRLLIERRAMLDCARSILQELSQHAG